MDFSLQDQLVKILKQNPENGFETRRKRQAALMQACGILFEDFRLQSLRNLKPKHVKRLLQAWAHVSPGETANRMAHLRWLANKLGKMLLIPESNRDLGIERRVRHERAGKFVAPDRFEEILARLRRENDRLQLMSGRWFGMRFKEAALFRPNLDVDGNRLWIKRGTKGGRPRYIWLVWPEQHAHLAELRRAIPDRLGCLVDKDKTYENWRTATYKRFRAAGLSRSDGDVFHDLRRTWADQELARLRAKGHSVEEAAKIVSKRLGHNRLEVLRWYLPFPRSSTVQNAPHLP
jgi:hypothetical protein